MDKTKQNQHVLLWFITLLLIPNIGIARQLNLAELTELGIDDLMNMEVTSFAMKSQIVNETPAAVFVISPDDICRSGATSVPELLQMVPGFQVAKINAHEWGITSRGFNASLSTKLLVMVDGRDVYNPLSAGVSWDEQDMMIGDIERIEVVRGSGGSLWGANAVNGVINIISKDAIKTQGTKVSILTGTEENGFAVRHGDALSDNTHFRVYLKGTKWDSSVNANGENNQDEWNNLQGGFRLDTAPNQSDHFTLQGDLNSTTVSDVLSTPILTPPFLEITQIDAKLRGGNLLGQWIHQYVDGSSFKLQTYYDHVERDNNRLITKWDTFDFDFSHNWLLGDNNEFTWGIDYRALQTDLENNFSFSFRDPNKLVQTYGGFLQDEHFFLNDRLALTVGSKFITDNANNFEYQPSARAFFSPTRNHGIWASVGRSVRTPVIMETDVIGRVSAFPIGPFSTGVLELRGNEDLKSEKVVSYESGYRYHIRNDFRVDLALFYNEYDELRSIEFGTPEPGPDYIVVPMNIDNKMDGQNYGAELAIDWRIADWWEIEGAYSFLKMDLDSDPSSKDKVSQQAEDEVPKHTITLRSNFKVRDNLELNLWGRFVDEITIRPPERPGSSSTRIDPSFSLDAQLAWYPQETIKISLVGQNLLDDREPQWAENRDNSYIGEIERSFYLSLEVEF